jgi:hypothetical protein
MSAKIGKILVIPAIVSLFWGGIMTLCRLLFDFSGKIVVGLMVFIFIFIAILMSNLPTTEEEK